MNLRPWMGDTIARRVVFSIALAIAATLTLNAIVVDVAGVGTWGRASITETGMLHTVATVVRIVEAQPVENRAAIVEAVGGAEYRLQWYAGPDPIEITPRIQRNFREGLNALRRLLDEPERRIFFLDYDNPEIRTARFYRDPARDSRAYFMGIELTDGSWLLFTAPEWRWGLPPGWRFALKFLVGTIALAASAMLMARSLVRPIEQLALGVQRFGADQRAPPIPLAGPVELRKTIEAFNAMQERIGRFVEDRTAMLAAISHDLRTPLTRMRLRAELIDDPVQQRKLFRDVDEMQGMIDAALSFFRDDFAQEPATPFDLPELLKSIVDDYGDQGEAVDYEGPDHASHTGRPHALRRVFANLVDNAIKYGTPPSITLRMTAGEAEVTVRDRGQGIVEEKLEEVFQPFHRLESSRNRGTGGVGLGLTSARSIVRAHGGELTLRNHADSGLEALVVLPRAG